MLIKRIKPAPRINRALIMETGVIPHGLQLIQTARPLKVVKSEKTITEDINGKPHNLLTVTGLYQIADEENANHRVYPYSILKEAVSEIQKELPYRGTYGELDHPADAKIHLDRICHVITKVWMDGKKVYGESEIIDELPYGNYVKVMLERKLRTAVSSRGVGDMEVKESGGEEIYYVTEGFSLLTWDIVADPSVRGCYVKKSVSESKNQSQKTQKARTKLRDLISTDTYQTAIVEEVNKMFR